MTRALVTGHLGFLGRHFKSELTKRGYQVVGVDIADPQRPGDAMELFLHGRLRFDLAIHCAAASPNRLAIDSHPLLVGAKNLALDAAYFDWAARTDVGHLVYISSSAAYPVHLQAVHSGPEWLSEFDIDLSHRVIGNPDAIYGWTKLTGEQLATRYIEAGGRATVVRPFSGYGSDQDARFPFGAFRDRAIRRDDPFEIWGSGEQVRDFIHVDDIVAGTLQAVDTGTAGPINLCTGVGTSMVRLAKTMCNQVGYSPQIVTRPDAPAGVARRIGDPTKLREIYTPRVSLAQGIQRALTEAR